MKNVLRIIKKEDGKEIEVPKSMFVLDEFFEELAEYIKELKIHIFSKDEDQYAIKILPLMHIMLYLLTYFKYKDQTDE